MKRAGMLKLRKFSTPMASVKATATSAYTLPSIRPFTSCCSSMLGHVSHDALRAREQLPEEPHGGAEGACADVPEERVVDGAQLRHQSFDAPASSGAHADQRAPGIMRIGPL